MIKKTTILKQLDATFGAVACGLTSLFVSQNHSHASRRSEPLAAVNRILVIRPGGLGDMILAIPVLRAIARTYPNAEIDLAGESRNVVVVPDDTVSGQRYCFDVHPFQFLRALRTRRYDVVVDLEQFHHFSAIFSWFTRAHTRVGFRINPRRNNLYTHLVDYDLDGFEGQEFMRTLEPLGVNESAYRLEGTLLVPGSSGEEGGVPTVAICTASSTRHKRWERERMVQLIQKIVQDRGHRVVLVGNEQEREEADWVIQEVGLQEQGHVTNVVGQGGLDQVARTLAAADCFIGCDSGLAHMSVAVGTATVVLFGPSDERKWGHQGPRHQIVRESLSCSPCAMFGYYKRCQSIACMKAISVEDVLRAMDRVLGEQRVTDSLVVG